MKTLLTTVFALGFATLGLGCNKSPPGGEPGSTFKVKGPDLATTLKQGESKVIDLSVDRDSNFKQAVKLDAGKSGEGLHTELSKSNVPNTEKDVKLTVKADKDAPLGDHVITITATPENGTATQVGVKVRVEKP